VTLSLALAVVVGVIIPGLTAVVTREHASDRLKGLMTGLLSGLSGGLLCAFTSPPVNVREWVLVLEVIGLTWVSAVVSYLLAWKPSGASKAVAAATSGFGVGGDPAR